ncbi:MAG: 16S rRNA (uracil(1498)-N(3))-methyltransferase [Chitinophagaceae bacterium]|nr:MAG: 16S rRNA (uracil(1498)-N(3))-methyltransferase [Chitinophagaceae bacterium]
MALPFFYKKDIAPTDSTVVLEEDTSKHVVQVLRMKVGEQLRLTDGNGSIYTCAIADDHRKKTAVEVIGRESIAEQKPSITIAISPVKNNSRFEWFLEKATEIGVRVIVPLICERTEKQQLKTDRLQGILTSAMLQSQQAWLPQLMQPIKCKEYIKASNKAAGGQRFIAHCEELEKTALSSIGITSDAVILIGPEGDFSSNEIAFALAEGFQPVSLGATRLRTETAGMVAAVLLSPK